MHEKTKTFLMAAKLLLQKNLHLQHKYKALDIICKKIGGWPGKIIGVSEYIVCDITVVRFGFKRNTKDFIELFNILWNISVLERNPNKRFERTIKYIEEKSGAEPGDNKRSTFSME